MEQNNRQAKIIIHPASVDMLANATWDFAKRMLWSKCEFGEDEILLSKSYIREFYEDIFPEDFQKECYSRFEEYCIRMIAAKENYWDVFNKAHPCVWFNKFNPNGFSKPATTHWREMMDNYKEQAIEYSKLMRDPEMRETLRNTNFFKPIRPFTYGNRNF